MKILKALSSLETAQTKLEKLYFTDKKKAISANEVGTEVESSREQYIQILDEFREQIKSIRSEILALVKMDSAESDYTVRSVITGLINMNPNSGFNVAMTTYSYSWLNSILDQEFAYKLCKELNALYAEKKNPDWIRYLNENTI